MATNDVYRLSVDYTLATEIVSPISGKTCFIPAFAMTGTDGTPLGTDGNPLVVATGGGGGSDMAVHGPDATGVAPTKAPVFVAGLNAAGHITPLTFGVAGTAASTVVTVQGIAGGTALPTSSAQLPETLGTKTAAASLSITPASDASFASTVGNRATFWPETSTPLAAAATFNGPSRDGGAASPGPVAGAYFNGFFFADQVGTASIEASDNGTDWQIMATDALAASTPLILQVPVMARYHRVVLVNGATLQTVVDVRSSYTAA